MDQDHLQLLERLDAELLRLGMRKHVQRLREYRRGAGEWTREHVEQLAGVLRVAPFQAMYVVKPRMASCGCSTPAPFTRAVVPGAALFACGKCHTTWLELG